MTPKERLITALNLQQPDDKVPHFEMEFQLTEEAFGPTAQRLTDQTLKKLPESDWDRALHANAELYCRVAERYDWAAIPFHGPHVNPETEARQLRILREMMPDSVMLVGFAGGGTYSIPDGRNMFEFAYAFFDRPREMHEQAKKKVQGAVGRAKWLIDHGIELIILNTDYALNDGPFLSPKMFSEFVTPYLCENVQAIKEYGGYVMMHTDGDLMPIMDDLMKAEAHALQSIDPQAGMDIAEIKRLYGNRICLMGNVQCSLLQDGPPDAIMESARYCLEHGKVGGGYIYSTSNVIFKGMPLKHYDVMLEALERYGYYDR